MLYDQFCKNLHSSATSACDGAFRALEHVAAEPSSREMRLARVSVHATFGVLMKHEIMCFLDLTKRMVGLCMLLWQSPLVGK